MKHLGNLIPRQWENLRRTEEETLLQYLLEKYLVDNNCLEAETDISISGSDTEDNISVGTADIGIAEFVGTTDIGIAEFVGTADIGIAKLIGTADNIVNVYIEDNEDLFNND